MLAAAVLVPAVALWIAACVVVVGGLRDGLRTPDRVPVRAVAPTRAALDDALALAGPFLDDLYSPRDDGAAAIAEYFGLPVRARLGPGRPWRLLGIDGNRLEREHSGARTETGVAVWRDGAAELRARLRVDWAAAPGQARIAVTPLALRGTRRVELALQERPLLAVGPRDLGRPRAALVLLADRGRFRSHRFTVRHGTNDGEQYEGYRGRTARAAALAATSRAGGFPRGRDIYAATWNASAAWPDDAPFQPDAYADCRDELLADSRTYPYASKTCVLPTRTFVWLSSLDPLTRLLQGLHVLGRHGDPHRRYRDTDHRDVTVAGELGRWERLFRTQDGIPRCSPVACDETWSSGVRTAVFGALETEMGYRHGDRVSRTYADRAAAVVLRTQIGRGGLVRSAYGTFLRPLEAGGFAIAWRRSGLIGFSPSLVSRSLDRLTNQLSMPREYVGFVASNAETSMAAYAFLARYRCARFGAGCRGRFRPGTGVVARR